MKEVPNSGFRNEFVRLADVFDRLAKSTQEVQGSVGQELGDWMVVDARSKLLKADWDHQRSIEYREAVAAAGVLCLAAYSEGRLQGVDGLAELVAAMKLGEWGGLVNNPANLFSLLVGGPKIELEASDGSFSVFNKPNAGWPIQFGKLSPRSPSEVAGWAVGGNPTPAREQSMRYAEFCRSLAQQLPKSSSPLPTNSSDDDLVVKPDRPESRIEWLAKAMLLVQEHPDWTDAKIARGVGKSPSTLSRSPVYQAAAGLARGNKSDIPLGYTVADPDSGSRVIEAVDSTVSRVDDKSDRGTPISGSKYVREYCVRCDEPIKVTPDEVGKNPVCERCRD